MRLRSQGWQISLALGVAAFTLSLSPQQAHSQLQSPAADTLAQAERRPADPAPSPSSTDERGTGVPQTGAGGQAPGGQRHEPGSGSMHEQDRTGSTGPSGSRPFSTTTGALDPAARVAKPAGDEAVTAVDRGLVARVRSALSAQTAQPINADNIHIKVNNGQVVLQGQVLSQGEKERISSTVAGVEGVQGLDNQLEVSPGGDR